LLLNKPDEKSRTLLPPDHNRAVNLIRWWYNDSSRGQVENKTAIPEQLDNGHTLMCIATMR
jgi:hypothetical protein